MKEKIPLKKLASYAVVVLVIIQLLKMKAVIFIYQEIVLITLDKIAFNQNDLIIIVGDKTSANTTSLFEKAKTKLDSKRVLFILNVDELKKVPLPININNIYLTSGTSASLEDVTSISNYLENLYK